MRTDLLHVFACFANPLRWRTRLENFRRFEHHIVTTGLPLTTVECSYDRRDWELPDRPGVRRVPRSRRVVAQGEFAGARRAAHSGLAVRGDGRWRYSLCRPRLAGQHSPRAPIT